MCSANQQGQLCSAGPATSGERTTLRNQAAEKLDAFGPQADRSLKAQEDYLPRRPANCHPATTSGHSQIVRPASVVEGCHLQQKPDKSSSLFQVLWQRKQSVSHLGTSMASQLASVDR